MKLFSATSLVVVLCSLSLTSGANKGKRGMTHKEAGSRYTGNGFSAAERAARTLKQNMIKMTSLENQLGLNTLVRVNENDRHWRDMVTQRIAELEKMLRTPATDPATEPAAEPAAASSRSSSSTELPDSDAVAATNARLAQAWREHVERAQLAAALAASRQKMADRAAKNANLPGLHWTCAVCTALNRDVSHIDGDHMPLCAACMTPKGSLIPIKLVVSRQKKVTRDHNTAPAAPAASAVPVAAPAPTYKRPEHLSWAYIMAEEEDDDADSNYGPQLTGASSSTRASREASWEDGPTPSSSNSGATFARPPAQPRAGPVLSPIEDRSECSRSEGPATGQSGTLHLGGLMENLDEDDRSERHADDLADTPAVLDLEALMVRAARADQFGSFGCDGSYNNLYDPNYNPNDEMDLLVRSFTELVNTCEQEQTEAIQECIALLLYADEAAVLLEILDGRELL